MFSSARTSAEWSACPWPSAAQDFISCAALAVWGRATPSARAPCSARFRSFWCSADAEARREGALDHALAMHFEDARGGEAAHQRLAHLGRVGAGLGGEHQRFADRRDVERDDDLVGDLADLAVATPRRPA